MNMEHAIRQIGEVTILDLNGRIIPGEVPAFGPKTALVLHELVRDLAGKRGNKILLNLENVTFIDSVGLGELVTCLTSVRHLGGQLKITGATEQVNDVLRITRLSSVLDLQPDETSALRSFISPKKDTSAA
jgi:anti-sigma B factor antagonist